MLLMSVLLTGIPRAAFAEPALPGESANEALLKEARKHFDLGVAHFDRQEWQAALVEFLESRELAPTKANTKNAAICLRKVGRFDEALVMFQALLSDFSNLPETDRELAQREITELSASVGSVEIRGAPAGARVSIDGIDRGSTPLAGPIRLPAGTHTVRVVKEGSLPFETRLDLAGRQLEVVDVKLAVLTQAGRLRVIEKRGRDVQVVVDGQSVGTAPWEGALSPGPHGVLLRGEARFGTSPKRVLVELGRESVLELIAVPLSSRLVVSATPAEAAIFVDGARVGRGSWQGGLEPGPHHVTVKLDGYVPFTKTVRLVAGARETVPALLEPSIRKARILLGLQAALPFGLSWGGDLIDECTSPCSYSLPLGVSAQGRVTYRFPSALGLGVHAGYLRMWTRLTRRSEAVDPNGPALHQGAVEDRLRLAGLVAGVDGDYAVGERWPLTLRLSAGALIGAVSDERTGTFLDSREASYDVSATQHPRAVYFYLGPEVSIGYRATERVETSIGAKLLVMTALTRPTWNGETLVYAGETDRGGVFSEAHLSGAIVFALLPGLAVSYAF
jgi:hypothetical protein